ncbi:MAG: PEGA domain-containing protein [Bdellovibrionales bacterium]|nr:PEGA domain-containing protein [Bdellovibrionales bacterium]
MALKFYLIQFLFLFFLGLITGCATIDQDEGQQRVSIYSDPVGADIFLDGKKVGTTPAVIFVDRNRKNKKLQLIYKNQKKEYELDANFRWRASGLGNLMFLHLYPIALVTDLVSGSAWEVKSNFFVKFKRTEQENEQEVIVIAPPQGQREYWAPEIAENMRRFASKKYSNKRIVPLFMTYDMFRDFNYDYHERPILDRQSALHRELKKLFTADYLLESFYEIHEQRLNIYAELIDLKNNEAKLQHNISLPLNDLKIFRATLWREKAGKFFNLIPNNIAFQAASRNQYLTLTNPATAQSIEYQAENIPLDGFLGETSRILNAININFLDPPTSRRSTRYEFYFVPALIFSTSKYKYEHINLLNDVEFQNISIGGAYGPQWSLRSNWGKTFLEFLMALSYNDVRWKAPGNRHGQVNKVRTNAQIRLGHTVFINDHLNITFFTQSNSQDPNDWQQVIDDIAGFNNSYYVESSSRAFSGVSLGYYFPVFENPVGKIYE